jgi:hypothetical protein
VAGMQDGDTSGTPESLFGRLVPGSRAVSRNNIASQFGSNIGPFSIYTLDGGALRPTGLRANHPAIYRAKAHGFCSTPTDDLTFGVDSSDDIGVAMTGRDGRVSVRLGVESNSSQHYSFAVVDKLPEDITRRSLVFDTAPLTANRGGGIAFTVGRST